MGDNREHSADSRAHVGDPGGGFIPVDDVVGKVFVVVWPLDRFQFIHRPHMFDDPSLDQAAGLVTAAGVPGLALIAMPPLYRVLRRDRLRRARDRSDLGRAAPGRDRAR
jgi:signal peptidase I